MKQTCFVLLLIVAFGSADLWKDCGSSDDKTRATIQSITVDPDPPKKGDLTIKATFTLKENVTKGAKATVSASLDGLHLYSGSFDLCQTLEDNDVGLKCPLSAGQKSIEVKTKIPNIAPRGHYTGNAKATDQNGKELACIDLDGHLTLD